MYRTPPKLSRLEGRLTGRLSRTQVASSGAVVSYTASLCGYFDATDSASYSGTGQTQNSLVASPADGTTQAANARFVGSSSSVESSDPTFSGSAGTPTAFWQLLGNTWFKQANATLTSSSILNNAHRNDLTSGAWVTWVGVIPEDASANHALWGNQTSGTQAGVMAFIDTNGILNFQVRNSGGAASALMIGVPRNVPVCITISWRGDLVANNVRAWVNTLNKAQYSVQFPAGSSATNRDMYWSTSNAATAYSMANGAHEIASMWGNAFLDDAQVLQIYNALLLKHGIDYTSGGPFSNTNPLEVMVFGNSITNFNQFATDGGSDNLAANTVGPFTWLAALSNHRYNLKQANMKGIAGNTTTDFLSRYVSDCRGKVFGAVLLAGPTNNVGNNPTPDTSPTNGMITDMGILLDYFAGTLGKIVFLTDIRPRAKWGVFTAPQIAIAKQAILDYNAWAALQHNSYNGRVIYIPTFNAIWDGTANLTPLANTTVDQLHLTPYGGYLEGLYLKNALQPYFGDGLGIDFSSVSNLLTNGTLTGTGGSKSGGVTGSVADSWTAILSGGTGGTGTGVASKASSTIQQLVLNWNAGGSSANAVLTMRQAITSGFAVGDTVFAAMRVQIPSAVNMLDSALKLTLSGTGVSGIVNVSGFHNWQGAGVVSGAGGNWLICEVYGSPGEYLIYTPDLYIAAGTSMTLTLDYNFGGYNSTALASSGTVQIKGAGIFKR